MYAKVYSSDKDLVIAQPFYCVPACLEMVLRHFGYTNLNQVTIARQLKINRDYGSDEQTWGARITSNTLNDFFSENNINLVEKFISIHRFLDEYDMTDEIVKYLELGSIICGYNYSSLFGLDDRNYQHVSIVSSFDCINDKVRIVDPGPKNSGIKWVDAEKLFYAIKRANDGLWCISPQRD